MLSKVNLKKLKNAHVSKPTDTRQQQKANRKQLLKAINQYILSIQGQHGWNLEGIMLSEISQTEKDKYCMISYMDSNKIKLIETENRLVVVRRVERWAK